MNLNDEQVKMKPTQVLQQIFTVLCVRFSVCSTQIKYSDLCLSKVLRMILLLIIYHYYKCFVYVAVKVLILP